MHVTIHKESESNEHIFGVEEIYNCPKDDELSVHSKDTGTHRFKQEDYKAFTVYKE